MSLAIYIFLFFCLFEYVSVYQNFFVPNCISTCGNTTKIVMKDTTFFFGV